MMGGLYPTASNYRRSGKTIRAPGPSRREGPANDNRPGPGKPANTSRPKGSYIPPKERPPRKRTKVPGKRWKDIPRPKLKPSVIPRVPAQALPMAAAQQRGFAAVMGRFMPYVAAFELGFLLGSILFKPEEGLLIRNPGNWEEYICPGYGDGGQGPLQESATRYPQVLGSNGANCISGQFVAGAPAPGDEFGVWEDYGVFLRRRHVVTFGHAGATDLALVPQVRWGTSQVPIVVNRPWADALARAIWWNPALMPINAPAIFPKPPPVWAPAPGNTPYHQVGNSLEVAVNAGGQSTSGSGATAKPDRVIRINRGNPRPPGRNVKEKKIKYGSRAYALMSQLVNPVTEGADYVKAVYKALDKKCLAAKGAKAPSTVWKPGHRSGAMGSDGLNWRWQAGSGWTRAKGYYVPLGVPEKAALLYRHFDCVDPEQALVNLIANEVEDRVIGKVSGAVAKGARRSRPHGGLAIGFEIGPAL